MMSEDLVDLEKLCLYSSSSPFLFHKKEVNPTLPATAQAATVWQQIQAFKRKREKVMNGKCLSHVLPSIVVGVLPPETAALKCVWVAFHGREEQTL